MNTEKSRFKWDLAGLVALAALFMAGFWQFADLTKVQATHETKIDANTVAILEVKKDLEHENDVQDSANLRFQEQMNQQLIRMQDKVDKIYDLVKINK